MKSINLILRKTTKNCCHQMSFSKSQNAPNSISAWPATETWLGELTALPADPVAGYKGAYF